MNDWPKWDVEVVDGHYNVVSVAHTFVDLNRFNKNFKKSNATILDLPSTEYAESLGMFAAVVFAAGVLSMIILLLITCLRCCCSTNRKRKRGERPPRSCTKIVLTVFLLVFVFIGLLAHGIGYLGQRKVTHVINDTCNTFDFARNKVTTVLNATEKIKLEINSVSKITVNNIQSNIQQTKNTLNDLPANDVTQGLKDQVNSFDSYFDIIKEQISKTTDEVDKQINPDDFKQIINPLNDMVKYCKDVKEDAGIGMLVFTIVSAVLMLLFLGSMVNNCLRHICNFIGFIEMTFMLVFLCVTVPLLVGSGDFCFNARPLIDKQAPQSPVIQYYLDCPNASISTAATLKQTINVDSNPNFIDDLIANVDKYFDATEKQLVDFDKKITDISTQLDCDTEKEDSHFTKLCSNIKELRRCLVKGSSDKNSLGNMIDVIRTDVKGIANEFDCNSLTPKLYSSLTNVCTDIYLSLLYYGFNFVLAFVALWILVLISSCLT